MILDYYTLHKIRENSRVMILIQFYRGDVLITEPEQDAFAVASDTIRQSGASQSIMNVWHLN
jgi:hypothetical protein